MKYIFSLSLICLFFVHSSPVHADETATNTQPLVKEQPDSEIPAIPFNSNPAVFEYRVYPEETYLSSIEEADSTDGSQEESPSDDSPLQILNTPHSFVSEGVETLAKYMDIFFADEKIYSEATKSYATLSNQFIMGEHDQNSYDGRIRLKIDLPKTRKKLRLLLESDAEEIQTGVERNTQSSPIRAASESEYYAGLQRELTKLKEWKFYSTLGMKLNVPLDPFFRLRLSRRYYFYKWNLHFSETLFVFDSLGAGAATLIELDRKLIDSLLFRSVTSATWHNDTNNYDFKQSFHLFHDISIHRAISFNVEVFGESRPTIHATSYLAYLRYRQRVHKDWLYFEVRPEVHYKRENDFHPENALVFQVDMIFGEKYAKNNLKNKEDENPDSSED